MAQRQTSDNRRLQSKVALWEQKVAPQKEYAVFTAGMFFFPTGQLSNASLGLQKWQKNSF